MNDEEYEVSLRRVFTIYGMLNITDLHALRDRMESALNLGPFTDPTLFRAASRNLEAQLSAVKALLPAREHALSLLKEADHD